MIMMLMMLMMTIVISTYANGTVGWRRSGDGEEKKAMGGTSSE